MIFGFFWEWLALAHFNEARPRRSRPVKRENGYLVDDVLSRYVIQDVGSLFPLGSQEM